MKAGTTKQHTRPENEQQARHLRRGFLNKVKAIAGKDKKMEINNNLQLEDAKRIYNLIDPWDRDDSKTDDEQINDIFNDISTQPEYVIQFLLDIIDNYTE